LFKIFLINKKLIFNLIVTQVYRNFSFYGIACGMNKIATGRATFFHNQISDAQHQIKREISLIGMGA